MPVISSDVELRMSTLGEREAVADNDGWSVGLDIGGTMVLGVLLDAGAAARGTARVVDHRAETSSVLKSMRMADRLGMIPRGALVAPIGAALAVRERPRVRTTEAAPWRS